MSQFSKVLTLFLLAGLTSWLPTHAGDVYWYFDGPGTAYVDDVSYWSASGTTWIPASVPTDGDRAIIDHGGTVIVSDDMTHGTHLFAGAVRDLWVGDGTSGGVWNPSEGHLIQYSGEVDYRYYFLIGRNFAPGASTYDMQGGVLNKVWWGGYNRFADSAGAVATMSMSNDAVWNCKNETLFGAWGGQATLNMTDNAQLNEYYNSWFAFGYGYSDQVEHATSTNTVVNMSGNASINRWGGNTYVGVYEYGNGQLNMSDNASMMLNGSNYSCYFNIGDDWASPGSAYGEVNMSDNATIRLSAIEVRIGNLQKGTGVWNIGTGSDSPLVDVSPGYRGGWVSIGCEHDGVIGTGTGTVNMNSGTFIDKSWYSVPIMMGRWAGNGTWNQNGGTFISSNNFYMAESSGGDVGTGTINLNGGTFQVPVISSNYAAAGSTNTVNFNGGVLKAAWNNSDWISNPGGADMYLYVRSAGALIDSNGYTVTIQQPLLDGGGGGGLTKLGAGTLRLTALNNTYTGDTVVNEGRLILGAGAGFTTPQITVKSGAILSGVTSIGNPVFPNVLVKTGGMIDPGDSVGALDPSLISFGNINFEDKSRVLITFDSIAGNDVLDTIGNITESPGGLPVKTVIVDFEQTAPGTFPLSFPPPPYTPIPIITTTFYGGMGSLSANLNFIVGLDSYDGVNEPVDSAGVTGLTVTPGGGGSVGVNFQPIVASAANPEWTGASVIGPPPPYNWSDNTNWTNPAPMTGNQRALFNNTLTTPTNITVTLDTNPVLSSMIFAGADYVINPDATPGEMITLTSTIAADSHITVLSNNPTINVPLVLGSADPFLFVGDDSTLTLGGVVSGPGRLAFVANGANRTGTLVLGNSNTYTGGTIIDGGTVVVGNLADGATSSLGASSTDPQKLLWNGGTLQYTGGNVATNRGFSLTGTRTKYLEVTNAATDLTLSGQFDSPSLGILVKTGPGTVNFTNTGYNTLNHTDFRVREGTAIFDGGADSVYHLESDTSSISAWWVAGDDGTTSPILMEVRSGLLDVMGMTYIGRGVSSGVKSTLHLTGTAKMDTILFSQGQDAGVANPNTNPVLIMDGDSNMQVRGTWWCGDNPGAYAVVKMSGNAVLDSSDYVRFAANYNTGTNTTTRANVTLSENSQIIVRSGWVDMGRFGTADVTVKDNAKFIVSTGMDFTVGDGATNEPGTSILRVQDNALVQVGNLFVGRWGDGSTIAAAGAIYQSGGTVQSVNSASATKGWCIGGDGDGSGPHSNAYGHYNLSGGLADTGVDNVYVGYAGPGVFYQSGGTLNTTLRLWMGLTTTGYGVFDMTGGTFNTQATDSTSSSVIGGHSDSGAVVGGTGILSIRGTGEMNINGGQLYVGYTNGSTPTGGTGIVNLGAIDTGSGGGGGRLAAKALRKSSTSTMGMVNFHGGTLKSLASTTTFLTTDNYIYGEGAVIDTNGFNDTISTVLKPPTGKGVQSIDVIDGGNGYIGPPAVQISVISGTVGTGATAIANMEWRVQSVPVLNGGEGYNDSNPPNVVITGGNGTGATATAQVVGGVLTDIIITDPGTGYTEVPTVTLSGGDAPTTPANLGEAYIGAYVKDFTITNPGTGYDDTSVFAVTLLGGTSYNAELVGVPAAPGAVNVANNVLTGGLTKLGLGTLTLTATNTYTGDTNVTDGVLKANDGVGLPNASYLNLDGGILESNTAFTFTRSFSAVPGASKFKMNNGGFSGGGGLLTVQMNGGTANVDWGDVPGDIGSKIVGVLKLSSPTAANRVDIQNQISLQGAERTIYVEDNTGSSADYAIISGKVTNGAGTPASILKLGPGTLELSNPANDYASSGTTTISAGALRADDNAGLPAASFLILDGGVLESRSAYTFTRGLATSGTSKFEWTANGGGFSASGGVFTINVGGTTNPVDWGSTVGTNLCGTLKFGSVTANDQTDFQNGINLNVATAGDLRTIDVTDNTGSTTDVATVSGIIADGTSMPTGGILKTGTGVLNPTGLNTYTGPTQVTAGTLRIDTFNNGGIAGPLGMSSDSATNLVVSSGGTVEYTGPTATTTRGLSVGSGTGSISVATEGVVLTDTGTLAVPSDSTLAKAGAGHLALTTSQTYTGTTQINAGYLRAQDGVGLPTNSPLIFNGGLLESNGAMTFTRTIGTAAGNVQWTNAGGFSAYGGPVTVQLNNGTDTINLTDASSTNSIYRIYFGSTLADNVVDFQNGLNLNGGTRTIYKYDNPATDADYAVISGVMSNSSTSAAANLMVRAPGTLMLTGANTYDSYTGSYTRIYEGVLNAIDGVGLPANSLLRLEGGVFESSGTFIRPISNTTGTNCVYWASTSRGGGFSAYGGPLNVNLGGALATVSFGTTTASQICGPLILSSTTTANDVVTIQNPLDLNGGARTVQVNDNPNKTTDWAVLSGAISNSTGTGSLVKTGDGTLVLTNNLSYNGSTTISAGVLEIQMTNALSTILGAGHLKVTNGVSPTTLTASSVNVGTLTVGSGAKLVIAPPGSGGAGGAAPVPEPSTFVLLALAGLGVLLAAWRRK